jgi:hypothetical protein
VRHSLGNFRNFRRKFHFHWSTFMHKATRVNTRVYTLVLTAAAAAALLVSCATTPPTGPMGFFVTSAGPGNGADLGGLAGADAHCQKLATAAGAGSRTWHAYLSTGWTKTTPAVNARDRIGKGPWFNAKGVQIATDIENLHAANNITKATALTESGVSVNGFGDTPNTHDILTGSRSDGTAFSSSPGQPEMTCGEWTKSGDGSAMTGHHDRSGLSTDPWAVSWNSSHNSVGCSQAALVKTGGAGRFYCFAAN